MTTQAVRDPIGDALLTPANCALIILDYQPIQVSSVMSMDHGLLVANIVRVAKTAKAYGLPIVVSTVNVKTGRNKPMIPELREVLPDIEPVDRTTINSWEDTDFLAAVRATARRKLVMTALWTEACLAFPALDAMREGYEVFAIVDAVGGTSVEAHEAGLQRIVQAGAKPTSWVQFICELQRDWGRSETVKSFAGILFDASVPFIMAEHAAALKP
jgi:nicotinamidase-related amidase